MGFGMKTPEVMTLEQVAEFLQVSYQTVYKLVRDKEIRAKKVGRSYRVLRDDVIAYFEKPKSE
ncbi:MAG: helix-turn-helix domain-containing protein [Carboxydocellales bacterium]